MQRASIPSFWRFWTAINAFSFIQVFVTKYSRRLDRQRTPEGPGVPPPQPQEGTGGVVDIAGEVDRLLKSDTTVDIPLPPQSESQVPEYTAAKIAWWFLKEEEDPPAQEVVHPELHDHEEHKDEDLPEQSRGFATLVEGRVLDLSLWKKSRKRSFFKLFMTRPGTNVDSSNLEAKCFVCQSKVYGPPGLGTHIRSTDHQYNFRNFSLNMTECPEKKVQQQPTKIFTAKLVKYTGSVLIPESQIMEGEEDMDVDGGVDLPIAWHSDESNLDPDMEQLRANVCLRVNGFWTTNMEDRWAQMQQKEAKIIEQYIVDREQYTKAPDTHPLMRQEWESFWKKRCSEVEDEGKDPDTYDYTEEWRRYWFRRVQEIMKSDAERWIQELKRGLGGMGTMEVDRHDDFDDLDDFDKEIDKLLEENHDPILGSTGPKSETENPTGVKNKPLPSGKSTKSVSFDDSELGGGGDTLGLKQPSSNFFSNLIFDPKKEKEKSQGKSFEATSVAFSRMPSSALDGGDWLGLESTKKQKGKDSSTKLQPAGIESAFFADTNFSLPFEGDGPLTFATSKSGKTEGGRDLPSLEGKGSIFAAKGQEKRNPDEGPTSFEAIPPAKPPVIFEDKSPRVHHNPSTIEFNPSSSKIEEKPKGSLLNSLTFLFDKKDEAGGGLNEPMERKSSLDQTPSDPQGKSVKKKVVKVRSVSREDLEPLPTLQLPSHLVSEVELKAMSSSLKTLYVNQLELQEQSYKEQMDFLMAQNRRKEVMLKDEIDRLQEDYQKRLDKMRAEIAATDEFPKTMSSAVSQLASQIKEVSSQLESLSVATKTVEINDKELKSLLHQEIIEHSAQPSKALLQMLTVVQEDCSKNFHELTEHVVKQGSQKAFKEFDSKLKDLFKSISETEESSNSTHKLLKLSVSDSIDTLLTLMKKLHEDLSTEKTSHQIKELRKELRQLHIDVHEKSVLIHGSQLSVEVEQRTVCQSIRDISSALTSTNSTQMLKNDPSHQTNNVQRVQSEMELKLLREERHSLSETIAQMNVDRRKLTDEKVAFERERMEFEREKVRIRETEAISKTRHADAEDLRKQADQAVQKERTMMMDVELRLQALGSEKKVLQEKTHEMQQAFLLKEQKLFMEKSELAREREFVDKLREEMLCPGCMKGYKKESLFNFMTVPPPSYYQSQNVLTTNIQSPFSHYTPPQPQQFSSSEDVLVYRRLAAILTPEEKAVYSLHLQPPNNSGAQQPNVNNNRAEINED